MIQIKNKHSRLIYMANNCSINHSILFICRTEEVWFGFPLTPKHYEKTYPKSELYYLRLADH